MAYLVTATVTTFDSRPHKSDETYRLLSNFVKTIQKANPGRGGGSNGLKNLLDRLRQ